MGTNPLKKQIHRPRFVFEMSHIENYNQLIEIGRHRPDKKKKPYVWLSNISVMTSEAWLHMVGFLSASNPALASSSAPSHHGPTPHSTASVRPNVTGKKRTRVGDLRKETRTGDRHTVIRSKLHFAPECHFFKGFPKLLGTQDPQIRLLHKLG